MTKAEAICGCNNIITLVEELDEILSSKGRDDYAQSVHDRMSDMRKFILNEWRSPQVTDKMASSIRNTWDGLRRWDHDDQFNSDLFEGLEDVIIELEQAEPAGTPVDQQTSTKPQKGREVVEPAKGAPPAAQSTPATKSPRSDETPRERPTPAKPAAPESAQEPPDTAAKPSLETVVRARERALSSVRNQTKEKNIRVVDEKVIQHGDLAHILNMTKSDRTHQLILAAFYAGKMAGIHAMTRELTED